MRFFRTNAFCPGNTSGYQPAWDERDRFAYRQSGKQGEAVTKNSRFIRYQGEVALGYGLRIADKIGCIVLETVHGVRIGPYAFVGGGLGIDLFYSQSDADFPVFANAKGYLPVGRKTSLYLSLDAGASIAVGGSYTGAYVAVGPGITFGRKGDRIRGDFGIRFQHKDGLEKYNAILLRIGIGF